MNRRKVNPYLLMPKLSDVASTAAMDRAGRDALETFNQIPDTDDVEFDTDLADGYGLRD